MSADWNKPTISSLYNTEVLENLKDRDFDAISLCLADPSNMIDGMLKLVRAPKVKIQERSGAAWVDRILDIEGGGTGGATQAAARTGLGLGTMAIQNSGAVAISGGTVAGNGSGLTSLTAANFTTPGTFPALNGSNLVSLNAAALATGLAPQARLGTGSGGAGQKVLLDNQTWGDYNMFLASVNADVSFGSTEATHNIDISALGVVNVKEIMVIPYGPLLLLTTGLTTAAHQYQVSVDKPTSVTALTIRRTSTDGSGTAGDVDLPVSTHAFFIARVRVS